MNTHVFCIDDDRTKSEDLSPTLHSSRQMLGITRLEPLTVQSSSRSNVSSHTSFTPNNFEYAAFGFGVELGANDANASEAAVQAVQDALSRSKKFATFASNCGRWRIAIKLGVPPQRSTSDTLHVDLARISSVVPSDIAIISVNIEVGGLWIEGTDLTAGKNACAVVASIVIQGSALPRETISREHAQPFHLREKILSKPPAKFPRPLSPPKKLWMPTTIQNNPMDLLARVSETVLEGIEPNSNGRSHWIEKTSSTTKQGASQDSPTTYGETIQCQHLHKSYTDHASAQPTANDGALVLPGGTYNLAFPIKLHHLLSEIEKDGYERIISWQPHGRAFKIHKKQDFSEIILPRYCHLVKLPSFFRQLKIYGFRKILSGTDKGAYYHELFLRHRIFLSRKMSRKKICDAKIRVEREPDFYTLPPVSRERMPPFINCADDDAEDEKDNHRTRVTTITRNEASANRMSFPLKLHLMLENEEAVGSKDVISWQSHGRGFAITDSEALVRELMPKYFRQTK